jgi:hypothetical protein
MFLRRGISKSQGILRCDSQLLQRRFKDVWVGLGPAGVIRRTADFDQVFNWQSSYNPPILLDVRKKREKS